MDHVDGLADPEGYLNRLREATGGGYVVVEKILAAGEELPGSWATAGTSGYDFLNAAGQLMVDPAGEAALRDGYARFTGVTGDYAELVYAAKLEIMRDDLAAEVERLTELLDRVCEGHRRQRDHTRRELREALTAFIAGFGVYRPYARTGRPASAADREHIAAAAASVTGRHPDIDAELVTFLADLLLLRYPGAEETEFAVRFGQVSSPVMAKGGEDTAFYRYLPLVSLNEVGGDPGQFGGSVAGFHQAMARVTARWPEAMLTLSTHDTKRSADVRARISLLSELPEAWIAAVRRWAARCEPHKRSGWPDRNTEYLLYQTLAGAWPLTADRAVAFAAKATREAKRHTSWTDPSPRLRRSGRRVHHRDPGRRRLRGRPGDVPGRAPARRAGPGQLAGADRAAADLPRRPRPVPGHRGVGPVPGRPGQPAPGRLPGPAAAAGRADRRRGRPGAGAGPRRRGRAEALADHQGAPAPPPAPRGVRPGVRVRAAAGDRREGRARGRVPADRRAGRAGARGWWWAWPGTGRARPPTCRRATGAAS